MLLNSLTIKLEIKSRSVRNLIESIVRTIDGLQIQDANDSQHVNLLIYEIGTNADESFNHVESVLHANDVDEVFLTSAQADQELLMQAIRTGVKEFLIQPLNEEEVRQALERFKERQDKSKTVVSIKPGHIINVIGAKGGVGTTTVAVNLATSLAEKKGVKSVALVDMNMLFGEVPLFLEIKPKHDLSEITKQVSRLDNTFLMNALSKSSAGVYVLPSPRHFDHHDTLDPKVMDRILELMSRMFDFVIIDGGHPLNPMFLKLLAASDTVLLTSVLTLPCLSNIDKLLRSLINLGYPVDKLIKVVMNRYLKTSEISLQDAENGISKKIFWTIPNDYRTTLTAINQGKALSQIAKNATITKSFKDLADCIAAGELKTEKKWWSALKGKDTSKNKQVIA
jgi:pilus assembly protein CpaE